ncbi:MAG: phosphatase PAP2 family protein [Candidatus Thiodiazotropha sp. (ex Lucinoma borealis)]|nr:phosphatase PAP2 family protein [Candidatus Thiodiazotropha sp. (ex Lucinoma borealis)]
MRFLHWPGQQGFKERMGLSLIFLLFFYAFYGGAAVAADFIPWRFHVGFEFEKKIPFIPESALIYLSLTGLMILALFVVRQFSHLKRLVSILCIQTTVAAVCFVLIPVENNFPVRPIGDITYIFLLADAINLTNNEVPSLHVCFAFTLAAVTAHYGQLWQRILLLFWSVAIAISTMTMHEHNLIDLLGGIILSGWGVMKWRHHLASDDLHESL